jgi:hypothetical protein
MFYRSQNVDGEIAQGEKLQADLFLQLNSTEIYPTSRGPRRLWFVDQLGRTSLYKVHPGFWFKRPFDMSSLQSSLQEIVNRHAPFNGGI